MAVVARRARLSASAAPNPAAASPEARSSVLIDAATDFAPKAPGPDVLHEQRSRPVLLAHAAMQVLEDAQSRVEADEIDELERAHRMIEAKLQRLVDVARRGHALEQHVERLVANRRVHTRRDEAGRLAHEH